MPTYSRGSLRILCYMLTYTWSCFFVRSFFLLLLTARYKLQTRQSLWSEGLWKGYSPDGHSHTAAVCRESAMSIWLGQPIPARRVFYFSSVSPFSKPFKVLIQFPSVFILSFVFVYTITSLTSCLVHSGNSPTTNILAAR